MKIFTVATHNYGYYRALKKSSKKNGFKLINLAFNKKWKGLTWKFKLMYQALQNISDNEIIAFCDGFDVIIANHANNLIKIFKSLNCDIIFGKENSNHNTIVHYLSKICFKYYYLLDRSNIPNSGVYVGYAGKIKKFLKLCLERIKVINDDQDITYLIYKNQKKHQLKIKLTDEYIYTIPFNKDHSYVFKWNNSKIKNITCDLNKVFFIHANGNRNMDIYLKSLKYPKRNIKSKSAHNHISHFSKMFFRNNIRAIFFIMIIILVFKIKI